MIFTKKLFENNGRLCCSVDRCYLSKHNVIEKRRITSDGPNPMPVAVVMKTKTTMVANGLIKSMAMKDLTLDGRYVTCLCE